MPLNIVQVQNGQIALVDADGTAVGTEGNPLRSDPTGDTAQPITATALPLPTGAATETTLGNIKTKTDNIPSDPAREGGKLTTIDTTLTAIKSTDGIKKITDALPTGDNTIGRAKVTDGTNVLGVDSQNHAYVSGKAAAGVAPSSNPVSVSGIDGSGLKRTLRTDMMGRLQFVPAAVATALPNMADLFWRASDAAIVANQFKRVLTYTVPAGYSGYLIRFTTWQAEAAYSRLVAETNFGSFNVPTNAWTSSGLSYAVPQFSGTVEAEVTTQFGSANNITITVGYTNQSGTAGRSTSFSVPKSSIVGTRIVVPLQSGDLGIRSVQTVSASPSGGAGVLKLLGFIQLAWHHDVSTTFGADTPYQQGAIAFPENTVLGLEYAGLGVSKDRILEALIQLVPNV